MRNFLQTHLQEQEFCLIHDWRVSQETGLVKAPLSFFYEEVTSKSSTKKKLLYAPEKFCEEHFNCLILDTLL
jgi:hypothetical protein